jgi:serine/threonine-protein kinase
MAGFVHGLRLSDRYVLERRIGAGGMSQVWLAEDEVLGRPVAIKAIDRALVGRTALTAIRREARAAASVSHPHVAQIYDYDEVDIPGAGLVPYLVMELLDGPDLGRRLADGPLPWPEAVRMAAEVARALAAAHATGVVHRDVKPGNIVLTPSGARVVDFGLAALRPEHDGPDGEDAEDQLRGGTPAFVAPEVFADDDATPAADVYGLGAVLFAALTGSPPIAVTSWAQARQAHDEGAAGAPRDRGLTAAIGELCARACRRHQAGRWRPRSPPRCPRWYASGPPRSPAAWPRYRSPSSRDVRPGGHQSRIHGGRR